MDGKSPVLSACGAKTDAVTCAVEVGSRAIMSRAVEARAGAAAAHAGVVKFQELAVQSRALEQKRLRSAVSYRAHQLPHLLRAKTVGLLMVVEPSVA